MDESRINRAYNNLKQAQLLLHHLVDVSERAQSMPQRLAVPAGESAAAGTDTPADKGASICADSARSGEIAAITSHLLNAQDDLIVVRETMQALAFENAALRQQLDDAGLTAALADSSAGSVLAGPLKSERTEARS